MPPYHLALGIALADAGDLARAEREFLSAASVDDLPESWLDLAAVRARLGDAPGAEEALDKALRLGYQQPAVVLGSGAVRVDLGDDARAIGDFTQALLAIPSLAGDPWWTEDPARARLWPQVLAQTIDEASPLTRFEIALHTSDATAAEAALGMLDDAEAKETYRLMLSAWNGNAAALASLEARARAQPFDQTLVNLCARLLRRAGDENGADTFAIWAESINGTASTGGHEVGVFAPTDRHGVAGVNSLFYGHFTYRRPTPTDQFVLDLPRLGYR
jgi:tetratricopeptide (TPR) repeat protein